MKHKMMLRILPVMISAALAGCHVSGIEQTETNREEQNTDMDDAVTQALQSYREFLKSDEMYSLTATKQYPRGDSRAVYAYGDCDGDGIPELHIDGGPGYYIYSFQDGGTTLRYTHCSTQSIQLIPLQDGTFLSMTRVDQEGDYSLYQKITQVSGKEQLDTGYPVSWQQYSSYRLDVNGNKIDSEGIDLRMIFERDRQPQVTYEINGSLCSEEEWELQINLFQGLSEDKTRHLEWQHVFPETERAYLDSLENNDTLPDFFDSPEGQAYQRILTGDFSFEKDLDEQSSLVSKYIRSLDEENGRSSWKYVVQDFNGDGIKDLIVRTNPEGEVYEEIDSPEIGNGILCFSYTDGEINWWGHEISKECYLPLRNGQAILRFWYRTTMDIMIGRWDTEFNFTPERIYEKVYVGYDHIYDEEWYRKFFTEQNWTLYAFGDRRYQYPEGKRTEGEYYFVQECQDGDMKGELTEVSQDEWQDLIASGSSLLIPEDEWNPVSVFMPRPEFGEYGVG